MLPARLERNYWLCSPLNKSKFAQSPRVKSSLLMRSRVTHLCEQMIRDVLKGTNDLGEDPLLRETDHWWVQRACACREKNPTSMHTSCEKAGLGQLQKLPYEKRQ